MPILSRYNAYKHFKIFKIHKLDRKAIQGLELNNQVNMNMLNLYVSALCKTFQYLKKNI